MIEAMAAGTPVIAWRSGSVPEVIDEGVSGFVVDIDRRGGRRRRAGAATPEPARGARPLRGALHGRPHGARLCRRLRDAAGARRRPAEQARRRSPSAKTPLAELAACAGDRAAADPSARTATGRSMNDAPTHGARAPDAASRPECVVRVRDRGADLAGRRPLRNLKHGDAFAVLDSYGDIGTVPGQPGGPVLPRHALSLAFRAAASKASGRCSSARSSQDDKAALSVDLTNPDIPLAGEGKLPRDSIFIERTKFLWKAVCYERIELTELRHRRRGASASTCSSPPTSATCSRCAARSARAAAAARPRSSARTRSSFAISASTASSGGRRSAFARRRSASKPNRATFEFTLAPGEQTSIFVTSLCEDGEPSGRSAISSRLPRHAPRASRVDTPDIATVTSSNELFDEVLRARRLRPLHADHAHRARRSIPTPASPGSAPSSAATASSPRC